MLTGKKKYKALWSLPIDLVILPISFLYYFIGRFFLAKILVATQSCNNCEVCVDQCPVKAIKMVNDRPYWTYRCESCMRCINICPQRAIETAHSFATLMIYIYSLITAPFLIKSMRKESVKSVFRSFMRSYITKELRNKRNKLFFVKIEGCFLEKFRKPNRLQKHRFCLRARRNSVQKRSVHDST